MPPSTTDLFDDPNLTLSKIGAAWLLNLDSRMRIGGFSKELGKAVLEMNGACDQMELRGLVNQHRIIPDAYLIEKSASTVYLFEIEDTNPLTANKLRKLSEIWFRLDSIDWEMRVFLVDRYLTSWRSLPMADVWHTLEFPMPRQGTGTKILKIDWEATHAKALEVQSTGQSVLKRQRAMQPNPPPNNIGGCAALRSHINHSVVVSPKTPGKLLASERALQRNSDFNYL